MNVSFSTMFQRLEVNEGAFQYDYQDRGNWTSGKIGVGELKGTKYGISAATYPTLDIENITYDEAEDIYYHDWYLGNEIDTFPSSLQFQLLDAAVNHGMSNAIKILQRAVGSVDDGFMGINTMNALDKLTANDQLLRFISFRTTFFTSLSNFPSYGKGWINRIAANLLYASDDN